MPRRPRCPCSGNNSSGDPRAPSDRDEQGTSHPGRGWGSAPQPGACLPPGGLGIARRQEHRHSPTIEEARPPPPGPVRGHRKRGAERRLTPPAVTVDGEEEWEVERVLDSRLFYIWLQYLVKWKGYDAPTWQPVDNLEHAVEAVRDFHRLNPDRPRPFWLAGARTIGGGLLSRRDHHASLARTRPSAEP